jgi:tetratricopeptide (TPR) repeat protein
MKNCLPLFCLIALFHTAPVSAAVNPGSAFDRANRLYEEGKYTDAIQAYQALQDQSLTSPALFFNLGNAYFKSGQIGRAIANYRLAQRLAPRDPDIRANLRFARQSIGTSNPDSRSWQHWLSLLTTNELALVAAGTLWLWCLVLVLGQVRAEWRNSLRSWRLGLGLVTCLAGLAVGLVLQSRLGTPSAVVIGRQADIRYGPFEEAQSFGSLKDGSELNVIGEKGTWLQVRDSAKRIGWLQRQDVMILPRG